VSPLRSFTATTSMLLLYAVVGWSCRSPADGEPGSERGQSAAAPLRPALPDRRDHLPAADRAQWRSVLNWSDACEDDFRATRASEDAGMQFHDIAPRVSLVQVLCGAGAYQPSFVFVLLDERSPDPVVKTLSFDMYHSLDGVSVETVKAAELTGEPWVSPDARELAVLSFSRQTRDCGIWTRYANVDAAPQVRDVRVRLPCPEHPGIAVASDARRPPSGWRTILPAPLH
jgi:hypothetical protein